MNKFLVKCPKCNTYHEASSSFFAKKILNCTCGKTIDTRKERYSIKECSHCGNSVMYDSALKEENICPVCKVSMYNPTELYAYEDIFCPTCACSLTVNKNSKSYTCPLCNTTIDIKDLLDKNAQIKKGEPSLIKYEGNNDLMIWKHPVTNFNYGTQLVVREAQEAIFIKDGVAVDIFSAGRYFLDGNNYPLVKQDNNYEPNNVNSIQCEVYFINLLAQTGRWGTDSKVRMLDPVSNMSIELGASGDFKYKVSDSKKLLVNLAGLTSISGESNPYLIKNITLKFKSLIVSKVKSNLVKVIKANKVNILEVDEYIDVISTSLKEELNESLKDYGLTIVEFVVSNILLHEDYTNFKKMRAQYAERYLLIQEEKIRRELAIEEQQTRIVEAQTEAQEDIIDAQAEAERIRLRAKAEADEMRMKGYTYEDETKRIVSVGAIEGGGIVSEVVTTGVALGVAGSVVDMTKNILNPEAPKKEETAWTCPNCGQEGITSKFCPECGTKKVDNSWVCPNCGKTDITSKFCPECGTPKPSPVWTCPNCGTKDIKSNFCPECGTKKS